MKRRTRLRLEMLEERELLSAAPVKTFDYVTPQKTHVAITLYGPGTLAGTSVQADGALDLVFANTNLTTGIVAKISGGDHKALLASIHDANLNINDLSGIGGDEIGLINLKNFNLISGGNINLTTGVGSLFLNAMGANAQVHLTAPTVPEAVSPTAGGTTSTSFAATTVVGGTSTAASSSTAAANTNPGGSTFNPIGGGAGNGANAGVGGLVGFAGLPGLGGIGGTSATTGSVILNATTAPFTTNIGFGGTTSSGQAGSLGGNTPFGGVQTATAGNFALGQGGFGFTGIGTVSYVGQNISGGTFNFRASSATATPGVIPNANNPSGVKAAFGQEATGVNLVINSVNASANQFPAVGDAQIYGYDPVQNALIRFDAVTGAALQTIPLSTPASTATGVALGRVNGLQVAVVGSGTTVQVFNASTGAFIGQFSTSNLASEGFTAVDGLGSTDTTTYLIDSSANTTGIAQPINLTASLATGQAVTAGAAFTPTRQFYLSGGATGVPAVSAIYLQGAGFLDKSQRNLTQNGLLGYGTSATQSTPAELARAELPGPTAIQNAGNPPTMTLPAVGSIDSKVAIVTSVANGQNVLSLYNSHTLAQAGTAALNDPNRLADISESFHPELQGTALVDVQGNLRSFRAQTAKGLVINDNGFLNLVKIYAATNTEVIGQPLGHAKIRFRKHVFLLSSGRYVGTRGGVMAIPSLQPVGPLSLPNSGP